MEESYLVFISNFQLFQYSTARSQVSFLSLSLLKVAQLRVSACKESFSGMLFNSIGYFLQSLPIALPLFNNLEAFLLYIVSSQCIELSLFATTLNIFFSERGTKLLTGTEVVKANDGFKQSVVMRSKPINTEAVNFFLCAWFRSFLFHFLFLFAGNKLWPNFQSCGSCFVEVWIYSFLNRNPNAYKDR